MDSPVKTVVANEQEVRSWVRDELRAVLAEERGSEEIGTKEAAELLRVSSRTVDALEKQGALKNYGMGRTKRYRRLDVVELKQRRDRNAVQS